MCLFFSFPIPFNYILIPSVIRNFGVIPTLFISTGVPMTVVNETRKKQLSVSNKTSKVLPASLAYAIKKRFLDSTDSRWEIPDFLGVIHMQLIQTVILSTKNISELLFSPFKNSMGRITLLNQSVAFEHKINKSNANVSANYQMCLHFEDICYDIFIDNRFSDFF